MPKDDLAAAAYLARHENASYYVDFADFSFWRLHPVDLYFVGDFGVTGWGEISEFEQAKPDPLAEAALGILQHMNSDHSPALIDIALHEKRFAASVCPPDVGLRYHDRHPFKSSKRFCHAFAFLYDGFRRRLVGCSKLATR